MPLRRRGSGLGVILWPREWVLSPLPAPGSLSGSIILSVSLSFPSPAPSLSAQPTISFTSLILTLASAFLGTDPSPRRHQTGTPPCPSVPVPGRPCRLLPSQYSSLFLTSVPNSALLALTPCPGPPLFLPLPPRSTGCFLPGVLFPQP